MDKKQRELTKIPVGMAWINPFQAVEHWFEDWEHRWLHPVSCLNPGSPSVFGVRTPYIDVVEKDGEIHVRAELPGVSKEDLSISVQGDVLRIQANVKREEKEETGTFHRRELVHGTYQRAVHLPTPVIPEKATATFKHGVMELTLPKKAGFEPTHIPIQ